MEHNHGVAAALEAVLESMDPRQRMSQASDDALVVLQSGARYELVLSDVQMPEKTNGIDLTE
jgi:CheY-like chemotaxis protein